MWNLFSLSQHYFIINLAKNPCNKKWYKNKTRSVITYLIIFGNSIIMWAFDSRYKNEYMLSCKIPAMKYNMYMPNIPTSRFRSWVLSTDSQNPIL